LYNAIMAIGRQRDDVVLKRTAEQIRDLDTRRGSDVQDSITVSADPAQQSQMPVRLDLPVGLENLRNTCYLNSILQYFFTVKPVRDLILNIDRYRLEPDENNLKKRRIGTHLMDLDFGDAFVAQNFVNELAFLFHNLQYADTTFVKPKQRLANAALLSSRQLIKSVSAQSNQPRAFLGAEPMPARTKEEMDAHDLPPPPPLPARPSPAPPLPSRDRPVVTVDAILEPSDTASNVSSQTLVNHADVDMVKAEDAEPLLPREHELQQSIQVDEAMAAKDSGAVDLGLVEPIDTVITGTGLDQGITQGSTAEVGHQADKLDSAMAVEQEATTEEKLMKALDNETIHGTDQEDVEEVMGKIIHHLHAAIKPTATDPQTQAQTDQIVETFYCNTINHTKKTNEAAYRGEIISERWLSAFPAEKGSSDLYEALDRNFDQQFIDADTERFTSIKELPPILHVHLQRTAPNGRKNENPIVIPEELYLDRYMDDGYSSALFGKRKRSWNLKRRLAAFDKAPPVTQTPTATSQSKEQPQDVGDGLIDDFEHIDKAFDLSESMDETFTIIDPQLALLLDENGIQRPESQTGSPANAISKEERMADLQPELAHSFVNSVGSQRVAARAELDSLFVGMTRFKYRLHAVVCHGGGQSTSGHYWVWIYDFEHGLWRKYNDTRVTEEPDTASVLQLLSSKGEPYYLAYVRDEDKDSWVDIPLRMRPQQPQLQPAPQPSPEQPQNQTQWDKHEPTGVEMQDVEMPELVASEETAPPMGPFTA
jgi:ubiquitin carboxyl-terminal hydrolase 25